MSSLSNYLSKMKHQIIKSTLLLSILTFVSCTTKPSSDEANLNGLTNQERSEGWLLLFDGASTMGWRGYKKDSFPARWEVKDGMLHCQGSTDEQKSQGLGGDLITSGRYKNFEVKFEWKISEGGNSGFFYLAQETDSLDVIYANAPEMQILDSAHPDWNMGTMGNRRAGSLYDMIAADPQNVKPAGEWNAVRVIADSSHVEHWQNGAKVLEYELWSDTWKDMVMNSKWKDFPAMLTPAAEGHFGLQDHGDEVWFRNMKVRSVRD